MPEVVVRLLARNEDRVVDAVITVPVDGVKNAASEEDAAMRFADWMRKKCPLDVVRVIRRGARVLVEVERV